MLLNNKNYIQLIIRFINRFDLCIIEFVIIRNNNHIIIIHYLK